MSFSVIIVTFYVYILFKNLIVPDWCWALRVPEGGWQQLSP